MFQHAFCRIISYSSLPHLLLDIVPFFGLLFYQGLHNSKVAFALSYREALLIYAQFGINSQSLLQRFSFLMSDLIEGKFELKKHP